MGTSKELGKSDFLNNFLPGLQQEEGNEKKPRGSWREGTDSDIRVRELHENLWNDRGQWQQEIRRR